LPAELQLVAPQNQPKTHRFWKNAVIFSQKIGIRPSVWARLPQFSGVFPLSSFVQFPPFASPLESSLKPFKPKCQLGVFGLFVLIEKNFLRFPKVLKLRGPIIGRPEVVSCGVPAALREKGTLIMPALCRKLFPAITLSLVGMLLGGQFVAAQTNENPLRRRYEAAPPPAQVVQPVAYAEEEPESSPPVAAQPPREIGSSLARNSRPIQPAYNSNHAPRSSAGGFQPQHLRSRSPAVAQVQYSDGPVGRVMRRWQPQPGEAFAAPPMEAQVAPEELPAPAANQGRSMIVHPEGDYSPTYESGYYEGGPEFGPESCGPGGCYPRPFGANWGRGCVELCFPFPVHCAGEFAADVWRSSLYGPAQSGW
jgi:hypothetical protein